MDRNQRALLASEINRVLFETWDPIGINHWPDAPRDEYSGYASRVLGMLVNGKSEDFVRRELDAIAEDLMGIQATNSAAAAKECVDIYHRVVGSE